MANDIIKARAVVKVSVTNKAVTVMGGVSRRGTNLSTMRINFPINYNLQITCV